MEKQIEEAIKLIVNNFPPAEELIKPTILHSIKVGMYLYDHNYSQDICLAGFLHDILEDTDVKEKEIKSIFGIKVLELIQANSTNDDLPKNEQLEELIERCSVSEEALIIKCADVIENHRYWSSQNREDEVLRCKTLANLIKKHKKDSYNNIIFQTLFKLWK